MGLNKMKILTLKKKGKIYIVQADTLPQKQTEVIFISFKHIPPLGFLF